MTNWLKLGIEICHPLHAEKVRAVVDLEALGEAHARSRRSDIPDTQWVRGQCPACGGSLVSNCYRVSKPGGNGYYLMMIQCWEGLGPEEERTCTYQHVL